MEGVTLLRYLEHAALVALWARHLYSTLRRSIIVALRTCTSIVMKRGDIQKRITAVRTAPNQDVATFIENFNTKKIARSVYQCKHKSFILKELRDKLTLLSHILEHPSIFEWSAPITHLVATRL